MNQNIKNNLQNKQTYPEGPLVSIVVITYNSVKYVIETLESIKNQTYKNIELIISDDSSTDNTLEVCRIWLENNRSHFVSVKLLNCHTNTGMAPNCNRGVRATNGTWIKLIAGDDYLHKDAIRSILDTIDKYPEAKIIIGKTRIFNHNVKEKIKETMVCHNNLTIRAQQRLILRKHIPTRIVSAFIRKDVFTVNGFFDESFPFFEDYPFFLKNVLSGNKIYYSQEVISYYRISQDSIGGQKKYFIQPNYFTSRSGFTREIHLKLLRDRRMYFWYFVSWLDNYYREIIYRRGNTKRESRKIGMLIISSFSHLLKKISLSFDNFIIYCYEKLA